MKSYLLFACLIYLVEDLEFGKVFAKEDAELDLHFVGCLMVRGCWWYNYSDAGCSLFIYWVTIWMFPKIVVPLNHPF